MAAEKHATVTAVICFTEVLIEGVEEKRAKLYFTPIYWPTMEKEKWEKEHFIQKISKIPVKVTR